MEEEVLKKEYEERYHKYLKPIADLLEDYILEKVKEVRRIDRVSARAKSIDSFMEKAAREKDGIRCYTDPINQIQDQVGARITTFYLSDIKAIRDNINEYFPSIEEQEIHPENPNQFDYEGVHFILFIPDDIRDPKFPKHECPIFFELQIKTMFQHAWAEANHDLYYKNEDNLSYLQERKFAFTNAQAWGADLLFDQLANELLREN